MTFPTKFAFIHPIWFVLLGLIALIAPVFTMSADIGAMVAMAFMTVWVLLLPLGWAHGIYRGSRSALAMIGPVGTSRDWVFWVAEVGVVCVPILALSSNVLDGGTTERVFAVVTVALAALYFVSLWLASAALVASEDRTPKVAAHRVVGTFLLMVYWMIGAWAMRRRLRTMRGTIAADGPAIA
ncbi:hypothetical protein [Brevundimonas sp.]|uniref:hypothetical protein n=1 Tax=Brevundimonas sp. TaxID=1871086 RepID=UPI002FC9F018